MLGASANVCLEHVKEKLHVILKCVEHMSTRETRYNSQCFLAERTKVQEKSACTRMKEEGKEGRIIGESCRSSLGKAAEVTTKVRWGDLNSLDFRDPPMY